MPSNFVIADVFTNTPFGGNQLAVFPDARGLSDADMQAFAREINFAETTFILPPGQPHATCRVRIFTPKTEVPFAGHPTIGTTAVLVHLERVRRDQTRIILEEGIGDVEVNIRRDDGLTFAQLVLQRALETPATWPSRAAAAATLTLPAHAVLDTFAASFGIPFNFIYLADAEAVDGASLDDSAWNAHFAKSWSPNLFFFSGDQAPGGQLYARMFAPALGVREDPATGSACAALAAILAERIAGRDGAFDWSVTQGVAMGRASFIEAHAEKFAHAPTKIAVGGYSVIVGEGRMNATA